MNEDEKRERFGELVDRLFRDGGLPDDESKELEQLRKELDELDEPYYRPIKRQLQEALETLGKQ